MKNAMWTICVALLTACGGSGAQSANGASDADIRQKIIEESWTTVAGKCPCPYTLLNSGKRCGDNSAYKKKGGGARPKCYASDVSDVQVRKYREAHPSPPTN